MRRALVILLAVLIGVPVLVAGAAAWWLDGDALKAQAIEAVRRQTGRELAIAGPVGLAWSWAPTLRVRDVSLANPPGFSRPDFAHVGAIEAEVALLPLLSGRVEIRRILLERPDIRLERNAAGQVNWLLSPPGPAPASAPAPSAPRRRMQVDIGAVRIVEGLVAWQGGGQALQVAVPDMTVTPPADGAPAQVRGAVSVNGVPLSMQGQAAAPAGSGPLDLTVTGPGLTATLKGPPAALEVQAAVKDLAALSALAGRPLPPVQDVLAVLRLGPSGLESVLIRTGGADLATVAGGLRLTTLTLQADSPAAPLQGSAEAMFGAEAVAVAGRAGTLASWLAGGALHVELTIAAAGATLSAQGQVDRAGDGTEITLTAAMPDLARMGAMAGLTLPAVRDASATMRLTPASNGLAVRGLRFTSAQGDVAGDLVLTAGLAPSIKGSLVSRRLDLDALRPVAGPAPAPVPPGPSPAGPPATPGPARVLPDTPLPFDLLRHGAADLRLTIGEAVWRGQSFRAAEARVVVTEGRLRLNPLQMVAPGATAPMLGQLTVDAQATPPQVALVLKAPGLAAGPVLAAWGAPEGSGGSIDLDVALTAAGRSVRALAGSLTGHVGAAMVDGEVDNRWLAGFVRGANLPVDTGGRSKVRCLALRTDAVAGVAMISTLVLDTTRLLMEGEGRADLGAETVDLHLHPTVRLGGTGIVVPMHVGGSFAAPKLAVEPAAGSGRFSVTVGALGPQGPDLCGPALTRARDGRPGPAPGAPEPVRAPKPADLLRSFLR